MTSADDGTKVVNNLRISETCWIYDEFNSYMNKLSEYVSYITQANIKMAEPWQVRNVILFLLDRHDSNILIFKFRL